MPNKRLETAVQKDSQGIQNKVPGQTTYSLVTQATSCPQLFSFDDLDEEIDSADYHVSDDLSEDDTPEFTSNDITALQCTNVSTPLHIPSKPKKNELDSEEFLNSSPYDPDPPRKRLNTL